MAFGGWMEAQPLRILCTLLTRRWLASLKEVITGQEPVFQNPLHLSSEFQLEDILQISRAAGIGFLIVILGISLLIGCWYCRRRSGYRNLTDKNLHAGIQTNLRERCPYEGLGHQDSKLSFQNQNCDPQVPEAPPAYEKLSTGPSPPPYSP
ncbi:melanoma antigen recognized by T-cells 1 [Urocitellus parryii]